jgi:hypothetical protein
VSSSPGWHACMQTETPSAQGAENMVGVEGSSAEPASGCVSLPTSLCLTGRGRTACISPGCRLGLPWEGTDVV